MKNNYENAAPYTDNKLVFRVAFFFKSFNPNVSISIFILFP